jgi:hypothetical protein
MGWVVNVLPRPLYPQERPGSHCIGCGVGPKAGLDWCGISRPHRDSLYQLSYPGLQTHYCYLKMKTFIHRNRLYHYIHEMAMKFRQIVQTDEEGNTKKTHVPTYERFSFHIRKASYNKEKTKVPNDKIAHTLTVASPRTPTRLHICPG